METEWPKMVSTSAFTSSLHVIDYIIDVFIDLLAMNKLLYINY